MEAILNICLKDIKSNWIALNNASNGNAAAVIKANSYGVGMIKVAKTLMKAGCNYFYVANLNEGIQLREELKSKDIKIAIFEGFLKGSEQSYVKYKLTPIINNLDQLIRLKKLISQGCKIKAILNIDTGMNRLGFDKDEINNLCDYLLAQPEVKVEGIFSHLAASEIEEGKDLTKKQINSFQELSTLIESKLSIDSTKHILNTSGIENYSNHEMDMVRLGIGLYVGSKKPYNSTVASLITRIAKIRNIKKGDHLGYGLDRIEKNMKIAIIPIGYADGFKRKLGNGVGKVYIEDSFHKTVGNICMDMFFIDISDTDFNVGDRVEIFGKNNDINKVAKSINTIAYELISSISNRVVRVYLKD